MSGPKVARTVAEAQVGDLIWLCEPERNRYNADGKYEGRGVWSLKEVQEVGRLSVIVHRGKYARDTGAMRATGGYSSCPFIQGYQDRADNWWPSRKYELADAIKRCDDLETLATVAFALGLKGPPDFARALPPSEKGDGHG